MVQFLRHFGLSICPEKLYFQWFSQSRQLVLADDRPFLASPPNASSQGAESPDAIAVAFQTSFNEIQVRLQCQEEPSRPLT